MTRDQESERFPGGAKPKRRRAALATALQSADLSRRDFLSTATAGVVLIANLPLTSLAAAGAVKVSSPGRGVQFHLLPVQDQLTYRITLRQQPVLENSQLGITVDGVELTRNVEIRRVQTYRIREKYAMLGAHAEAVNHANGARVSLYHTASKTNFNAEVRVFDDGIAFRLIVPGEGKRVPDEATTFVLPSDSLVWYHDFEGHYEGVHAKKEIAGVKEGEWAAPPVTFKLRNGAGYASITEAALMNYAGMGLQGDGQGGFKARLGHALPVSYPFRLRYGAEEGERLKQPAAVTGTITTPWRVVM
ncbi:MAG: glycoside hydrolase family 97 N-terminal domain-containing protein, partial [Pyrinomonadaceae bacterium]